MRFVLFLASVQVNLEHHADCDMQHVAKKHKDDNVIPLEELEKWADDVKSMTLGGVRPFTMYRCIGENIKPRKLGTRGVRKVRNMSDKVSRGRWASKTDALELVADLERGPATVKWESDANHVLRSIMWASPEQIILARTYGGIVIQDNTCLTNRYDFKLCLFVGVDSENKTVIFAQGLLSNEQISSFDFANRFLLEICGGHPKVIITDADAAMTSSVAELMPHTKHLYCSWHISKNLKRKCGGKIFADVIRRYTAASFATSMKAFERTWNHLKEVVEGTPCEEYINGYLYDQRKHWARCYHPTTMTLGMTASQRVEGSFSVIKNGGAVRKNSTFGAVRKRVETVAEDLALASRMWVTKAGSLRFAHMEDDVKKAIEPVMKEYEKAGASTYARREIMAEMVASDSYDTTVLVEGRESKRFLEDLAAQPTNNDGNGDVCCQVPADVFDGKKHPDTSMFGTTCLQSFYRLVAHVDIDAVVKVVYKRRKVGHLVVIGPDGFQLCTCLQLMRRGLQCRHVLAALVTELDRASEFKGESIHPRWRPNSLETWSLDKVELGSFDEEGRTSYQGGFTADWQGGEVFGDPVDNEARPDPVLSVQTGRTYANLMEVCLRCVRMYTENMSRDTRPHEASMFSRLEEEVQAFARRRSG
ncbi:unnamed protein product, partial [Ectocarpus fasciculatus]